jgi:hypothetical protein
MHTQETIEAVFRVLLDPNADFIDAANELGLPLTEFLKVAESPQITGAIEALEKLARIRERALLARAAHTAIAALERIADTDPETPSARETARKAAAQLLRMAAKGPAPSDPQPEHVAPAAQPTSAPSPSAHHEALGPPESRGSDPDHTHSEIRDSKPEVEHQPSQIASPRSRTSKDRTAVPA